jgi:hypothetical protein
VILLNRDSEVIFQKRDPDFYKDRRLNTKSPLGTASASVEETAKVITRGFRKPEGIIVPPVKKVGFFGKLKRLFGGN